MLPRYKRKNDIVIDAVQFKGDAMSVMWITELLNGYEFDVQGMIINIFDTDQQWITAKLNDYVAKYPNGRVDVLDESEFNEEYELC